MANRLCALALALMLAACRADARADQSVDEGEKPRLGVFTSLPIFWGEGDFAAILDSEAKPDWVRAELEKRFELVPLDTLEPDALEGLERVILAQPRALAPSENVAFDAWVRQGGTAAIWADPLLTRHSDYALGDKRRPQDVALISPILKHWGLELRYDPDQPAGERLVDHAGIALPVDQAGSFAAAEESGGAQCRVLETDLLARCSVGAGAVHLFADTAFLDWEGPGDPPERRRLALRFLTEPLAAR